LVIRFEFELGLKPGNFIAFPFRHMDVTAKDINSADDQCIILCRLLQLTEIKD